MKNIFYITIFVCLLIGAKPVSFSQKKNLKKITVNLISSAEQKAFLDVHNTERSEKKCPDLTWDDELAKIAASRAKRLAEIDKLEHSKESGYGENLFWGQGKEFTIEYAAKSWLSEKKLFKDKIFTAKNLDAGHYTQMIWKKTIKVGAGKVTINDKTFIVALYSPAGNYVGQAAY